MTWEIYDFPGHIFPNFPQVTYFPKKVGTTLEPEPPARSLTYVNVVTFTYVK